MSARVASKQQSRVASKQLLCSTLIFKQKINFSEWDFLQHILQINNFSFTNFMELRFDHFLVQRQLNVAFKQHCEIWSIFQKIPPHINGV